MAHHHNIVQLLQTPNGYVKLGEPLQFTNDVNEARQWRYWSFAFSNGPEEKINEMKKLGFNDELIKQSNFIFHKLYEIDE